MTQPHRPHDDHQCESSSSSQQRATTSSSANFAIPALTARDLAKSGSAEQFGGARYHAPIPFAWQQGRQLLLLDEEPDGLWVMAELWFDNERCRYVEGRRASYEWPREAIGALLCRVLPSGESTAAAAATSLSAWFTAHHGSRLVID
ncbi:MAG TPA: hypothetical protein VFL82_04005 [Thermomicrobiales bacterium]|jgi:hypothetical protein|nr:hypothetical protein [Thermomicrobiales bacterium]